MPNFDYQARDKEGRLVKGQLTAQSASSVVDILLSKGLTPLTIDAADKIIKPFAIFKAKIFVRPIRTEELIIFCRQMYALLKASVPLLKALSLIVETTRSDLLNETLRSLIDDITAGKSLTESVRKHPKVFSPLFVSLIESGENSGQLDLIFLQLSEYMDLMDRTSKQVKTATRYPIFVISAIGLALLVVNFFVIPNFAQVFAQFNLNLPLPTRILLYSSNFLIRYWLILLLLFASILTMVIMYLRTSKGRYQWDRYQLKIPIFGNLINSILLGRFTRSFSMVLKTGVPIVKGIELVANITDNEYMKQNILTMRQGIERGETLTQTATKTNLFTPMILQMFNTGEETGMLDSLLQETAEFYEREVEYTLKHLIDLIEPFLLGILGIMVLVLALGIFLPMWDMVKLVQ